MSKNVQNIMEMSRGFREARIILSAVELGVFEALAAGPKTAEELASERDLDVRAAAILLDALASLDVICKNNEAYSTATPYKDLLNPDHADSVLPALWHTVNMWRAWSPLTEVVRQGHPDGSLERDATTTEHFIAAMRVGARQRAPVLAEELDLSGVKTLLDLGGGPGSYAIAFAKREPNLKAVVFDMVGVTDIATRHIKEEELLDRITTLSGNYLFDPIGGPYDLIWTSSIVHMHTDQQNRLIVKKAADALNPGGRLIIRDFLLNEDGAGPASAAIFAVNMLVATEGGRSYKASEIKQWLEEAGLKDIKVHDLEGDGLVVGHK